MNKKYTIITFILLFLSILNIDTVSAVMSTKIIQSGFVNRTKFVIITGLIDQFVEIFAIINIGILTIFFSNKHRNLTCFDINENRIRSEIISILEYEHFIHFNKLREILDCGVSILKWHIQVLYEFQIIKWNEIGQYKVIYLADNPPDILEVNLYYCVSNKRVCAILNEFLKNKVLTVNEISLNSVIRKDKVQYYIKKLENIEIIEKISCEKYKIIDKNKILVKDVMRNI